VKPRSYRNRPKADLRGNLHPLVQELYRLVDATGLPQSAIAARAGYNSRILTEWKRRDTPMLAAFDNVLQALGKKLAIVDME
jgi:hypothetical protein